MNIKKIKYYFRIWWHLNIKNILPVFNHNPTIIVFLIGKIIRFVFFGGFIYFLLKGTNTLAGYSLNQTLFFFLTFNLIDITGQFLFREVYRFRPQIISGTFDFILTKPMSPLFRVLLGGADATDLITLPPLIAILWYYGSLLDPNGLAVFYYIILVLNGLVISAAFHILVLAMGIITLEIDHTVMIYRDLVGLGRFPVDIYKEPLRSLITFIVPIGLMISIPAKALMGLINPVGVLSSVIFGIALLMLSLQFWKYALKKYTSASS